MPGDAASSIDFATGSSEDILRNFLVTPSRLGHCQAMCARLEFSFNGLLGRMSLEHQFRSRGGNRSPSETGAPDTIRTCDLCLRSNLTCPTPKDAGASDVSL